MKVKWTKTTPGTWMVRHVVMGKKDAEELLSRNSANRKISKNQVAELVDTMNSGHWMLNGDTIVVDSDGCLKSGQHRLTAFVKSNLMTLECLIVNMIKREDILCSLNRGKPLTVNQYLSVRSVKNASRVSAVCRAVMSGNECLKRNVDFAAASWKASIPPFRIEEFYNEHMHLVDIFATRATRGHAQIHARAAGIMCWMCLIFPELQEMIVKAFNKVANHDTPAGSMEHGIIRVLDESWDSSNLKNTAAKLVFSIVDYIVKGTEPRCLLSTDIRSSLTRIKAYLEHKKEKQQCTSK